ncbi:glutamate decarboxylase-like protein [Tanacetum coccineum]
MPDRPIPKDAAYQIISDELMLDGNPRLNLASFVTTWMEPECDKLIMSSINKNYVDMDEYPVTTELQNRCVNMIAHLFHAPVGEDDTAVGVGTVGSSEAIMLAGLAFKRKWQAKRKSLGKTYDRPNIVTGSNVQVCWEKFARYFEVDLKEVKLKEGYYVMDPVKAVEMVDENTICVAAILGSTMTGEFEDVKLLNDLLMVKNKATGWDTPIHVDAASGGFVAPFLYPDLEWDFRLPLVKSINVSGHKYGLVYAGVGWIVWRTKEDLPDELVFHINYLGSDQPTFTLNFSKEYLRRFGWIVPAYTMPPDAQHISVLRVVIREDFSHSLAERLIADIVKVVNELEAAQPTNNVTSVHNGEASEHKVREMQKGITKFWRRFVHGKIAMLGKMVVNAWIEVVNFRPCQNWLVQKLESLRKQWTRKMNTQLKAEVDRAARHGNGFLHPTPASSYLSTVSTYAKIPKLYRASEVCDKNEQLHVFDSEETLEDAEKSQLKMNEFQKDEKVQELKIQPIDYEKLNKLYKEFVSKTAVLSFC